MPPHVAALVVVAVASVAATAAFYQFVYEPHIAPAIEAWAEDFIARRRAARNARAVPVSTSQRSQRPHSSSSSSSSSSSTRGADGSPRDDPSATSTRRATRRTTRTRGRTGRNLDNAESYELEALVANDVEEWRNNVRRSQRESGLRRRRGLGLGGRMHSASDHDLDHMSTTLDESITELTHTPITPTHVISNVSSPVSSDGLSISSAPHSPTRAHLSIRNRSSSTTTAIATAVQDREPHTSQPSQRHFAIPPSPPVVLPKSPDRTTEPDTDTVPPSSLTSPRLITIPSIGRSSSILGLSPVPQSRPDYTTIDRDEDSPFGPLLPDTPRSSPALYAVPGTEIINSHPLPRGSSTGHRASALVHEISRTENNGTMDNVGSFLSADNVQLGHDHMPIHNPIHSPSRNLSPGCQASSTIVHPLESDYTVPDSSITSLSLRYPAPPTSPVMVSRPPSEGVRSLSSPSSQNSMSPPSSEELRSLSSFSSPEWVTLPMSVMPELVLPATSASVSPESVLSPGLASSPLPVPSSSRPESASGITGLSLSASTLRIPQSPVARLRPNSGESSLIPSSPTTSYASFATPASVARTVSSVSDVGDVDFLSAAEHYDENDDQGRVLNTASHVPFPDRAYNPFLDYEEVFEVGSDESDDDDHGSDGSGSGGSWGSHGSAELH
ncbi:hypothetical protein F5141DRAFT_433512 [Pisolithus sp. B1]|nr:hypothetical protein F5141DRAFT_433512 [Pisolithus sp. B1]